MRSRSGCILKKSQVTLAFFLFLLRSCINTIFQRQQAYQVFQ
jgi:hypothetical protein